MVVLNIMANGGFGGIETLCLNLYRENKYTNYFLFLKLKGDIFDKLSENNKNILFYQVEFDSVLKKVSLKQNIDEIVQKCIEWKVDIIANHYDCWYTVLYYNKLLKKLKNVIGINFVHYCYEKIKKISLYKKIFYWYWRRKAFKISDYAIFVSNAGLESYKPYYKYMKHIKEKVVIYNGINKNFIVDGNNIKHDYNHIKILYVGRIVKEKGIENLIKACSILSSDGIKYECNIVGDGEDKDRLIKMAKDMDVSVTFHNSTATPQKYYARNNVFVYPSIWKEIFGISIVEAMSYGLIPIVNKVGGLPEIITDGENGFFTKQINAQSIADTIIKVINLPEKEKNRISVNAKNRASTFSIVNTANNYKTFFERILNEKYK